jgi:hypothetical protein
MNGAISISAAVATCTIACAFTRRVAAATASYPSTAAVQPTIAPTASPHQRRCLYLEQRASPDPHRTKRASRD